MGDPSLPGNSHFCPGWLKKFKSYTMKLSCKDLNGLQTNCWDVMDSIQIHAYAHKAADVKSKIQAYYNLFKDDFEGLNGRKRKTLWLTEVAMGSNNGSAVASFVNDLMNPVDGLGNRESGLNGGFGFVSHVSWFSEFFFPSFNMSGYPIREYESWSSSLFEPYG